MDIKKIEEEIIKEFKKRKGLIDKHSYLIKIGKELPAMNARHKKKDNTIEGCQFRVWIYSRNEKGKIFYEIDSESLVIKGIAALLIKLFSGRRPQEIKKIDFNFIDQLGLGEDLSFIKVNNISKITEKIKKEALLSNKSKK